MNASPEPGSATWAGLITASKVAAIVGLSPNQSAWELWHVMRGDAPPQLQNDGMSRGHLLEPAVLTWWRQCHSDAIAEAQPWFELGDWGGARPDLHCIDDGHGNVADVEAKTDGGSDAWGTPGTDEIPAHYAAQVQWQMACSDAELAYVPMLGSRLRFAEYVVRRDEAVIEWLIGTCWEFWGSLAEDAPPELDASRATLACLKRMHPDIDKDSRVTITKRQATRYAAARTAYAKAEARKRAAEAPIRAAMGSAQYACTRDGTPVIARQASGRGITIKLLGDAA